MQFIKSVSGAAPFMLKYQIAATVSILGVPHLVAADATAGLAVCTTTGAVNMVGCNTDTGTYATSQNSDGSDPDAMVTFICNPDAVWEIPMSGGVGTGTALTAVTVTTASATGTAITTASEWSSPTFDEGTAWGFTGANAGIVRKITSVSATAGTVTVAFPQDTVVGDQFLRFPVSPATLQTITLNTALTQARQDVAVATNTAEFLTIAVRCNDSANNGLYTSALYSIARYHYMNATA